MSQDRTETAFNPFSADKYIGGAWLTVLSRDFRTRLYTTRLTTNGVTHAIDARDTTGSGNPNIVFAGSTRSFTETFTTDAFQPTAGGGVQDGWVSVIGGASAAPTADQAVRPILQCVQTNSNGAYTARFGYLNYNQTAVTIQIGANNSFQPNPTGRGQTTVFQPGQTTNAFDRVMACSRRSRRAVCQPVG